MTVPESQAASMRTERNNVGLPMSRSCPGVGDGRGLRGLQLGRLEGQGRGVGPASKWLKVPVFFG